MKNKKPKTPRLSRSKEDYLQSTNKLLTNLSPEILSKLIDEQGPMMYTSEDVAKATHPLVKILRKVFVKFNITEGLFTDRFYNYTVNIVKKSPMKVSGDRSNLNKVLKKDTTTWHSFIHIVSHILGLRVVNIHFEFLDNEGNKSKISLVDEDDFKK